MTLSAESLRTPRRDPTLIQEDVEQKKGKRVTKGSGICGRKGIKALKKAIRRFWKVGRGTLLMVRCVC